MQKIHTTADYLKNINESLYLIPRANGEGLDFFSRACPLYFVMGQPTVKQFQDPITPEAINSKKSWLTEWLHSYVDAFGAYHDDPESIQEVQTFKDTKAYNIGEYLEPRGSWRNFNDFFARSLKPGLRPIAAMTDSKVITSPTDCTYGGQFEICSDAGITIKGVHWEIAELLKDYPTQRSSKVVWARDIRGNVYFEITAEPLPQTGDTKKLTTQQTTNGAAKHLDAPDLPGHQFAQTRGLVVLDSPIGLVAVLPVGMAHASSIVLTAEEDVTLRKGEEISYFQFGGSDVLILSQGKANVNVTAQPGTHYRMGTVIGHAYPAGQ
ncbi:phosphatidylserine decarboxylase proenzyme 2 [Physcia stellaris]|nr:phosphatidylserine decarboxylase proenzyme 2 [Physcia stellaris]